MEEVGSSRPDLDLKVVKSSDTESKADTELQTQDLEVLAGAGALLELTGDDDDNAGGGGGGRGPPSRGEVGEVGAPS